MNATPKFNMFFFVILSPESHYAFRIYKTVIFPPAHCTYFAVFLKYKKVSFKQKSCLNLARSLALFSQLTAIFTILFSISFH